MTSTNASAKATPYQVITTALVDLIEQGGELPWSRPWSSIGADAPVSVRGHHYRGINRLILGLAGRSLGLSDPRWITFNQARERGGCVRKGSKSLPVILWKPVSKSTESDDGERLQSSYLVARYYRVFPVEWCDGIGLPVLPVAEQYEWDPIKRAEEVAAGMPKAPSVSYGGERAFYRPAADSVTMPPRKSFADPVGFYGTLFHELAHSTGHASRLGRKIGTDPQPFGSPDYSREELVAEIAAAFVCGAVGIDTPKATRDHAAYLAGWIRALRTDAKAIVVGAAQASKAADWILGQEVNR